jgi:MFS family permease
MLLQYIPFVYLGPFLSSDQVGLSEQESAWLVSSLGLCNIVGRISLGMAADRLGRYRVLQGSLLVMIGSTIAYSFCGSVLSAVLVIVIPYGTFSGSFIAMPPALIAMHVMPRLPSSLGTMLGFNWLAMSIGSTFGPPLAGLFVDGTAMGWHLLLGSATVSLLCGLLVLCLVPTERRQQQQQQQQQQRLAQPAAQKAQPKGGGGAASTARATATQAP